MKSLIRFDWSFRIGFTLAFLAAGSAWAADAELHWKCSTDSQRWTDRPNVAATGQSDSASAAMITIDPAERFQTIEGWGGCFNERGWKAMEPLSADERGRALRSMFDPVDGLKLNLCRSPIASSDYAIELYSYDETVDDFEMAHFSIDRDKQRLIPYIKAAMALRPDLQVWGVPWSPPSWMKDSGLLTGGHIKTDSRTLEALALYFVKYVQAYRAAGIPLYMVMPQNEPCYSTKYSSCEWTGEDIALFVKEHLGPALKKSVPDCLIYLGTFPRSEPSKFDYDYWAAPTMNDPAARSFISGIGCQWGGEGVMRTAHEKHPELKLMQTEAECGKTNTNDWEYASQRFGRMVTYFGTGAESYMIWNLVLDETGLSTAAWAQCSPIVVDQMTKKVTYTPYYWMYRHLSSYVAPGAVRISAVGSWARKVAFANPNGQIVILLENPWPLDSTITLHIGAKHYLVTLPPESINTFTIEK